MLQELEICDYALISRLRIIFSPGLNILTGETGAGKSIIIGAVGLMLGERSSPDVIRTGAESTFVNGTFEVADEPEAIRIIREADLKDKDSASSSEVLILYREFSKNGRSRFRINDHSTTLSTVREVGDHLIDIHGQHEHQTLFRPEKHLDILDSFAGLKEQRQKMADVYARLQELQAEYDRLIRDRDDRLRQKDLLEFQLKELEDAKLEDGEEERLLRERQILNNAELVFELANSIYERIYNSEEPAFPPVLDVLKAIKVDLSRLHQIDSQLEETQSRLESTIYELADIAEQMRDYRDRAEFDPRKLSEVEARLDLIYRLKRKYIAGSVADLISYKNKVAGQLEEMSLSSSRIDDVRQEIHKVTGEACDIALQLSQQRQHHAKRLKSLVEQELYTLGMEKTIFEAQVLQNEDQGSVNRDKSTGSIPSPSDYSLLTIPYSGKRFKLSPDGIDSIEFLISPNVGEELRPLTRIASGGEISRIMLAVKTVLARSDEVATMIFDEIDTGIGGRIAEVVGRKLKELSKARQVICITHLPQMASLADSHCRVQKRVVGDRTVVEVQNLDGEEKVMEIARMLAGEKITDVTIAHAREMIKQAREIGL